jgi:CRISPR/Cas system CMR subunit Cmr4 (Cas7 group RAMP superfamily)
MDGFVTAMNGVRHMQMGGKATVGRGIVRVAVASQP